MKKSKILIGLLAVGLLATGCGPKTPEEALQKAFEETGKVTSLRVDANVEAGVKTGGMTVSLAGTASVEGKKISDKAFSFHAMMNMGVGEEELNFDAYYSQTNEKDGVFYAGTDEEWIKGTLGDILAELNEEEITPTDMELKFKEVKKVSSENDIILYEATIDKEKIKQSFQKSFEEGFKQGMEEGADDIDLSGFNYDFEDIVIKFSVNKKNLITKIETEIPVSFSIDMQEQKTEFTITLKMNIEFSKYNEVEDIKIPEEVKEKAVDLKEQGTRQYVTDYVDAIGWDVWEHPEKDNGQYTDTTLEYDGPQPTKVDVLVENEEVVSGVIEINGYTAIFEDFEMISFEKTK